MSITAVHPKSAKDTQTKNASLFHVILLNDNDHSYDYVIEMLQKLFIFLSNKPTDIQSKLTLKAKQY